MAERPGPGDVFDVELKGVTKVFASTVAVRDATLSVQQGEFLTLLGPSGCGKTTMLRMIAGLETPTEGEIFVRGVRVDTLPPFERDTAMVFQNYALFPHKTVAENVAFGLKYRGVPRAEHPDRVRQALEMVRLPGLERRYPAQLSGGQQQRVALARALVLHPTVLLLDEPLSNLDQNLREQMRLEIKQIQERVGITFVMVTHDQEEAIAMSDRLVVMHAGRLMQTGTPQEIYHRPNTHIVAAFMGRSNFLRGVAVAAESALLRVRTTSGLDVVVPPADGIKPGTPVLVQVRGEYVRLHARPPEGQNVFRGRITRRTFLGTRIEYALTLERGEELMAMALVGHTGASEDAVWISVDPADCVVIVDPGAAGAP